MRIKNTAKGPRTVEHKDGDTPRTVVIRPGEEAEVELFNKEDPVFKAMVAAGELLLDGSGSKEQAELDRVLKDEEKLNAEVYKLQLRKAELQEAVERIKYQNDPTARDNRMAAMMAGHTPGLADPSPPGTDHKGGEESKAALERQGFGDLHGSEELSHQELAKGGPDRHAGTSSAPAPRERIKPVKGK